MHSKDILNIIEKQREYFKTGITRDITFRIEQLKLLKRAVECNAENILEALRKDLRKPSFEAYAAEIGFVINEIDFTVKNLKKWASPKKARTPVLQMPGDSFIYPEPYGNVLIISPWNYPFLLTFSPLIGAAAAGNCCIIKPSEYSINSSSLISRIIDEYFKPEYIKVIKGDAETSSILLKEKFDYVFFTGSTNVGKIVMASCAEHLTPLTIELGGKNPCIVDKDVNIEHAARRIAWGKFFNAGQTCIAPDYLLVHKDIKMEFLAYFKRVIVEFYGKEPIESPYYPRIINEKHFERLVSLLKEGDIIAGGDVNKGELYIAPTVIDNISWSSKIMEDEIFGPILPVMEYDNLDEAIKELNKRPKPLALYIFSNDKEKQEKVLNLTSSGGVSINETLTHAATLELPFGGVGQSGTGAYHGKATFDTFTHFKSVFKKPFLFDIKLRYPPYKMSYKKIKGLLKF
ncbi:MAG: aldehyde dehydrogenase [Armatimonadota bacterium]